MLLGGRAARLLPFEVERLRQSLDRLLLAMVAILEKPDDEPEQWLPSDEPYVPMRERIQALHRMICTGLDEFAATLTIVGGIGPTMAKRLQTAGIADIEDLALAEPAELAKVRGLSHARADKWISEATNLVKSRSAYRYRETGPVAAIAHQVGHRTLIRIAFAGHST